MDAFTHGLASYTLTRAILPRATRVTVIGALLAGMAPDVDQFSQYASPTAFLICHRTFCHSIAAMFVIPVLFSSAVVAATRRHPRRDECPMVFLACAATCALHIVMDLTQNEGVRLLSPLRFQWYSADWVAHFDLWILLILLAGVLVPQLLGLVTEEIGAKSKAPRGRVGPALALLAVCVYIGARGILHGNAVGMMEARTYRGELPRRVAAFGESDSPLRWRGIVETERALHEFDLDLASAATFNPDGGVTSYKPEPAAALEAARSAELARRFLAVARFPRASVEKTAAGFRVQIRDLADSRDKGREGTRVMAVVETDANARVLSDELEWSKF
jgi:membrane-bound metal-dependent hydrolase YbcI (DUF457 family)